ncbi:uncharacterized protein DUF664 [Tamaricihabitans halophyticus]|uniref:Uncharacterized protein DUF664 n=1 Tax=Tamaricihabitans halophyticus TaxID=1262583 RepID=A0A4R2QMW7_9PSEU|nr:DinB family protein [Tamaricihabitans halophyticus]TCP50920.1 uncharacterized protein DUF664 [Tamaricihabitans halophyticus]
MTQLDEQGRLEPPVAGDELDTLMGFLNFQRETFAWKCRGLTSEQLATTAASSTMTLGGMLRHLSFVEDIWFSFRLHANPPQEPWDSVDWTADPDWDWHSAAAHTPQELLAQWELACARSRELTADAVADGGLARLAYRPWPDGRTPNLRWILCHMIEEYARHNGHADLIRESLDGETGE